MIESFTDWLQDWADQYLHELENQSVYRANLLQSLIACQDWEACREFIGEWEHDDSLPDSLVQKYNRAISHLRQVRANASANSLTASSAGVCSSVHSIDKEIL